MPIGTAVTFDEVLIGPTGQSGIETMTALDAATGQVPVSVSPESDLTAGTTVVLGDANTFAGSGLYKTVMA